ncbi:MAG: glycoside hydrolase [Acutalibacteraceae bacterium]|nr:glycoside hydrolase [Acutalibacteraceae bacterium]
MKKIIISKNNMFPDSFKGWGTSLCWWAHRLGISDKLTEDSARLFFSKEGLQLNIMRYNIGGGDDPTHNHIERTDSDIPGWLKKDKNGKLYYDYNADAFQLKVLKKAYETAGEDAFVEAFSNSPPYFMTVSGCSSGSKSAIANNLKKSCITDFAEYLAHVSRYINDEMGIKIGSLAAMNEPYTNYWRAYSPKQEGCHVSPGKMQSAVICATARAMEKAGLTDVDITASDETNTRLQNIACKCLSPEAWDCIDRISTHTYSKATPKISETAKLHGKPLWMTETDWSSEIGENAGEMGPALWLGHKIIEDLSTLKSSAWVIWQIVASYISQYEYKGKRDMPCLPDLTKGYWGVAFSDMDKEEIYLTQKYYAFGQFSRFIRPGAELIKVDNRTIACYDKKNKELHIVCVNDKAQDCEISFKLDGFILSEEGIKAVRTSGSFSDGEQWKGLDAIKAEDNGFKATLKGNSITTYTASNVKENN